MILRNGLDTRLLLSDDLPAALGSKWLNGYPMTPFQVFQPRGKQLVNFLLRKNFPNLAFNLSQRRRGNCSPPRQFGHKRFLIIRLNIRRLHLGRRAQALVNEPQDALTVTKPLDNILLTQTKRPEGGLESLFASKFPANCRQLFSGGVRGIGCWNALYVGFPQQEQLIDLAVPNEFHGCPVRRSLRHLRIQEKLETVGVFNIAAGNRNVVNRSDDAVQSFTLGGHGGAESAIN